MGSSGDVAMEGKMAGVVAGVRGMVLEEGGKRGLDCSILSAVIIGRGGISW
jgi:hypothetical protein